MIGFIELLRAIATALVANSHFKGVYPNDSLAFGGGFGLALFFMISGYLLANINRDTNLVKWYFPKILRLYIPLYITRLLELLVGFAKITSIQLFVKSYIFPGTWFGGAIMVLYLVYFWLVKYWMKGEANYRTAVAIGVCAVCYCLLFIFKPSIAAFSIENLRIEEQFSIETPYLITQFIWLICMLVGYWFRKKVVKIPKDYLLIGSFAVSILAFLAVKLIVRSGQYMNLKVALGPIYLAFALSLFLLLSKYERWCQAFLTTFIGKLVAVISMCSLEIYYIQFMWIAWLRNIQFPVNLLMLIVMITVSAYAVHWLSLKIVKKISVKKRR